MHAMLSCFGRVQLFVTHGLWPSSLLCPWDSPGKNTAVGCHDLLQGIFLSQGSNTTSSAALALQADSLPLSHQGSPKQVTYTHVHSSIIHNSQGVEPAQCPSIDKWINKLLDIGGRSRAARGRAWGQNCQGPSGGMPLTRSIPWRSKESHISLKGQISCGRGGGDDCLGKLEEGVEFFCLASWGQKKDQMRRNSREAAASLRCREE